MTTDKSSGASGVVTILLIVIVASLIGWRQYQNYARFQEASRLTTDWAEKLDRRVDERGIYIRTAESDLPIDPWGNRLRVEYIQSGIETIIVRSAGPDGRFGNDNDLVSSRSGGKVVNDNNDN